MSGTVEIKRFRELGKSGVGKGDEDGVVERGGIERELRVIRVGPNPRMVVCEYWELRERRVCVVNVRDNRRWWKGVRFKMEEPREELAYRKPWVYEGVGPRRRGRW